MDIVEQAMVEAQIASDSGDAGYGKPKPKPEKPKPKPKPKMSSVLFGFAVLFGLLLVVGFALGYNG